MRLKVESLGAVCTSEWTWIWSRLSSI